LRPRARLARSNDLTATRIGLREGIAAIYRAALEDKVF